QLEQLEKNHPPGGAAWPRSVRPPIGRRRDEFPTVSNRSARMRSSIPLMTGLLLGGVLLGISIRDRLAATRPGDSLQDVLTIGNVLLLVILAGGSCVAYVEERRRRRAEKNLRETESRMGTVLET